MARVNQNFPFDTACHHVFRPGDGHPERSSIQHLCVDDHSACLIVEKFDPVASLVHEDVYVLFRTTPESV